MNLYLPRHSYASVDRSIVTSFALVCQIEMLCSVLIYFFVKSLNNELYCSMSRVSMAHVELMALAPLMAAQQLTSDRNVKTIKQMDTANSILEYADRYL